MNDMDHWHTTHVAGLALLPPPITRPIRGVSETINQTTFWSLASTIFPKSLNEETVDERKIKMDNAEL
jgi:hypothetical protein